MIFGKSVTLTNEQSESGSRDKTADFWKTNLKKKEHVKFKFRKMTYKRKKYHYGDTHLKKKWRTKRRTRDLDQIDTDLTPENAEKLLSQPVDLDKSGNGQFYCVHCAKYLIDQRAFQVRKFDIFLIK